MRNALVDLYEQLTAAGIPVAQVSFGTEEFSNGFEIHFSPEATPQQQQQAATIMSAWLQQTGAGIEAITSLMDTPKRLMEVETRVRELEAQVTALSAE